MNRGEGQLGNIANINQHNTIDRESASEPIGTASPLSMLNMHIKTVLRVIRCVIH